MDMGIWTSTFRPDFLKIKIKKLVIQIEFKSIDPINLVYIPSGLGSS